MKTFLMQVSQFSKFISLLLLLFMLNACSVQKEAVSSLPKSYMAQNHDGLIYDASFQYKDFQASGLLVMKRLRPSAYHVVLLSKFGPAIMEFTLDKQGITWIKTFDRLDKKILNRFIAKDFNLLLLSFLEHPKKARHLKTTDDILYYKIKDSFRAKIKVEDATNRIVHAESKGFPNLFKSKAKFTYQENDIPQNIALTHNNINLRIDLNLLKVNHAER